jgi:tetratricopeptide (TPR) repeat protein
MDRLSASGRDCLAIQRDAQALLKLNDLGLGRVVSVGEHAGVLYQVLEPATGPALQQHLRGRPLPTAEAVELVAGLARAVGWAHEKGVPHLDLHPGTIERSTTGALTVSRFALAAVPLQETDPSVDLEQLPYRAPEQLKGQPTPDMTADVFSLGVLLCELLTGRTPWSAGEPAALRQKILKGPPFQVQTLDASLPRPLRRIVDKCLERNPELRYESAVELAADLKRFLSGEVVQGRRPGLWRRLGRSIARHPFRNLVVPVAFAGVLAWALNGWSSFDQMSELYFTTLREKKGVQNDLQRTEVNLRESLDTIERMTTTLGRAEFEHDPQVTAIRKQLFPDLMNFHSTLQRRNGDMVGDDFFVGMSKLQMGLLNRFAGDLPQAEENLHNCLRLMQFKRRVPTGRGNLKDDDPVIMTILAEGNRHEGLLLIDSQRAGEAVGCFDAALYNYDQILQQQAGTPVVDYRMARILMDRARARRIIEEVTKGLADLQQAEQLLQKVTTEHVPEDELQLLRADILRERGLLHLVAEAPAEAERELREALAVTTALAKQPDAALDLRPRLARLHGDLADVLRASQQQTGAETELKNALEHWKMLSDAYPRLPQFFEEQANLLVALGQTAEAEAARAKAQSLVPQNPIKMAIPREFVPKQLP